MEWHLGAALPSKSPDNRRGTPMNAILAGAVRAAAAAASLSSANAAPRPPDPASVADATPLLPWPSDVTWQDGRATSASRELIQANPGPAFCPGP